MYDEQMAKAFFFPFTDDGAQGKLPQETPLWYADYFELKTIKTQKTQEEYLSFPSQTA